MLKTFHFMTFHNNTMENYGLGRFKEFYKKKDIERGFMEVYGETLKNTVMRWKNTVANWWSPAAWKIG